MCILMVGEKCLPANSQMQSKLWIPKVEPLSDTVDIELEVRTLYGNLNLQKRFPSPDEQVQSMGKWSKTLPRFQKKGERIYQ